MHAVATEELRRGVDHNIDAVLKGAEQSRSEDGVVADHGYARLVGEIGDTLVIGHVVPRIADRFQIHEARVRVSQFGDLLRV